MTTIVLGANGKLGGVLYRHAARDGAGWLGQSRSGDYDLKWDGTWGPEADSILQAGSTLINMIGNTSRDEDRLQAINNHFAKELLVRAQAMGVAHVILASSAAVYGAGGDNDLDEEQPSAPQSAYGQSKVDMENMALDLAGSCQAPPVSIVRIANVAGSDALSAAAARFNAERRPMPLHKFPSGLAALRSYIGPKDLFTAIKAVAATPPKPHRVLNICAPSPIRLDALLAAYKTHLYFDLEWNDETAPAHVPEKVALSTERLAGLTKLGLDASDPDTMARQVAEDRIG